MKAAAATTVLAVEFSSKRPSLATAAPTGRIPRVTRMLAIAHKIDAMVRDGEFVDYADAARRLGLTRARVTQITNLLLLAPQIQDAILDLPPVTTGRDPISDRQLRPIAATSVWTAQYELWDKLSGSTAEERMPKDCIELSVIDNLPRWNGDVPEWAWGITETIRQGRVDTMCLIGAYDSGTPVGFLLYEPTGGAWGTHFHEILVAEPYRRRGIGRRMYDHMLSQSPPRPITAYRATEDGQIVMEKWGFSFQRRTGQWVLE